MRLDVCIPPASGRRVRLDLLFPDAAFLGALCPEAGTKASDVWRRLGEEVRDA
ncbi:MAG: hypothetical protein AAF845_07530 [Bacteroidota bacterium]